MQDRHDEDHGRKQRVATAECQSRQREHAAATVTAGSCRLRRAASTRSRPRPRTAPASSRSARNGSIAPHARVQRSQPASRRPNGTAPAAAGIVRRTSRASSPEEDAGPPQDRPCGDPRSASGPSDRRRWRWESWRHGQLDRDNHHQVPPPSSCSRCSRIPRRSGAGRRSTSTSTSSATRRLAAGTRTRVTGTAGRREGRLRRGGPRRRPAACLELSADGPVGIDVRYELAPADTGSELQRVRVAAPRRRHHRPAGGERHRRAAVRRRPRRCGRPDRPRGRGQPLRWPGRMNPNTKEITDVQRHVRSSPRSRPPSRAWPWRPRPRPPLRRRRLRRRGRARRLARGARPASSRRSWAPAAPASPP